MRFIILATIAGTALSVKHGDEKFAGIPITDGKFYAFCNGDDKNGPSIDIVDPNKKPDDKDAVVSIKVDKTSEWSDAVYMESCASKAPFVFAADRELDQIYVVDPAKKEIKQKVKMSEKPVHVYGIPQAGEFWAHADDAGVFDVIDIKDTSKLFKEDIKVHASKPGHGKLLFDDDFYPQGYASNTKEPYVFGINMKTHKPTKHFNFTKHAKDTALYCPGTHGLAYSSVNKHIYATCSGVGLMEMNPVDGKFDAIARHSGVTGGQVYESPDEKYIVTLDKTGGAVHLLKPNKNGEKASTAFPSIVAKGLGPKTKAGNPDKPAFIKTKDGGVRLFASLTSPNSADIAAESASGVGWIDMKKVEANPKAAQTFNYIPAGSVAGGGKYTYRAITAGGQHVATVAAYPTPGLAIFPGDFDAAKTPAVKFYKTNVGASRVLWVPNSFKGLYCKKDDKGDGKGDDGKGKGDDGKGKGDDAKEISGASQLFLGSLAIISALITN